MNQRASTEIRKRWEHGDVLGLIGGLCQKPIADELADLGPLVVEWGIGYSGVLDNSHKVFESYAWAHHVAGLRQQDDISFFDTVIPNCFNPNEFRFREPDDFVLFMGRPTIRKGLPIVEEIAKRIDSPVLHAGQPGQTPIAGTDYLGIITGDTKADTLARARAVLVPTTYLEPFGGVAVEAMMSGTPVITTDWGAFTETVEQGVTGFRCRTLREFLDAVDASADLDRAVIRDRAIERFSTDEGSRLYSRYLERVSTLHGAGWYAGAE
jgi:glycosyltransferase involved in cell wall biosynthesis